MKIRVFLFYSVLVINYTYAQWQSTSGPTRPASALIYFDQFLFAGCSSVSTNNGIYKTMNNGDTWISCNNNGINYAINSLATVDSYIFAAQYNEVYISGNLGENWTNVSSGLPSYNVNTLAGENGKIFAGTFGLYYSTNYGLTWENISPISGTITSLAVQGNTIFAGTASDGIYRSTNLGIDWTSTSSGLPNSSINAIEIYGSIIVAGTNLGIYKSVNYGSNWNQTNISDLISSFCIIGTDIFAGSNTGGVFKSFSNCSVWANINEGLEILNVRTIAANDYYLFAGCYPSVVCRRPLSQIITQIDQPSDKYDLSVYPNPASSKMNINFPEKFGNNVELKIFNINGNSEFVYKGPYQKHFELDVRNFIKGVHFLILKTDKKYLIEKIIIK